MSEGRGVLADRIEHDGSLEQRSRFPQDENRLLFQPAQMVHGSTLSTRRRERGRQRIDMSGQQCAAEPRGAPPSGRLARSGHRSSEPPERDDHSLRIKGCGAACHGLRQAGNGTPRPRPHRPKARMGPCAPRIAGDSRRINGTRLRSPHPALQARSGSGRSRRPSAHPSEARWRRRGCRRAACASPAPRKARSDRAD